jgi:hypothetical protein
MPFLECDSHYRRFKASLLSSCYESSSSFLAGSRDFLMPRRLVCEAVGREQCLPIEGLDAHEHLETTRSRQEGDEMFLPGDLRIALEEEPQAEFLIHHGGEKFFRIRVLVEVVGREHDRSHASRLGSEKTRQCGPDALAASAPSGHLRDRTEVA